MDPKGNYAYKLELGIRGWIAPKLFSSCELFRYSHPKDLSVSRFLGSFFHMLTTKLVRGLNLIKEDQNCSIFQKISTTFRFGGLEENSLPILPTIDHSLCCNILHCYLSNFKSIIKSLQPWYIVPNFDKLLLQTDIIVKATGNFK